jgi:hypothetical protein
MSINTLDVENQRKWDELQDKTIAVLWDIANGEDFGLDNETHKKILKDTLVNLIYNLDISSDKLKEYQ